MSKARQKGTAFETLIVNYLKKKGYPHAERRAMTGAQDKGDISFDRRFVLECKDHKTLNLSGWLKEALTESLNAGAEFPVVVAKRRGYGDPGDQYVVMDLRTFIDLYDRITTHHALDPGIALSYVDKASNEE